MTSTQSQPERCALCREAGPIRDSHLIPGFVSKWVKETSATGYLRGALEPNKRMQDYPTIKLLCDACENRFSVWEQYFAETVFKPYVKDWKGTFAHDARLLKFVVSLAWRTIETMGLTKATTSGNDISLIRAGQDARRIWRKYLLGERPNPGKSEHYLVLMGPVEESNKTLPRGYHTYTLRAVDATPISNKRSIGTYVKFPGIVFFSPIVPRRREGWGKAKVLNEGTIGQPERYTDSHFWGFYLARIGRVFQNPLSERQLGKIGDQIVKNPGKAAGSKTFEAMEWAQGREENDGFEPFGSATHN